MVKDLTPDEMEFGKVLASYISPEKVEVITAHC